MPGGILLTMDEEKTPFPMDDELKAEIREQHAAMGLDEDAADETIAFLESEGGFMGSGWQ